MQVTGVGEPGPFQDSLQAWANGGLVSDLYGASLSLSELWHPPGKWEDVITIN